MAEKRVSVRIAAVGGQELKAQMHSIGVEGREALTGISSAAGPASAGMQKVDGSATAALGAMEQLSQRAGAAAAAMRNAATSVTPLQAQINKLTGVTPAIGQTTDSFLRQGQAIDDLRAKFNPTFGVIRNYRNTLGEIRNAHYQGAISADEMANAISRERQEALASIAALKGRSAALTTMASSTRLATHRMQNMSFQLNDIGVSLAGGMNPFLVMAQQGTQIAQIYGFGQGGVGQALRDVGGLIRGIVTRFPLVTAAVVAGTAAIWGMTNAIDASSEESVSMGNTMSAVFTVIGDRIMNHLRPIIDKIAPWFQKAWDAVIRGTQIVGNALINGITVAVDAIGRVVGVVPNLFAKAFLNAKAEVLWIMNDIVSAVGGMMGGIGETFNEVFGTNFSTNPLSEVATDLNKAGNDAFVAASKIDGLREAFEGFGASARETMARDPMGDFFNDVREEAIKNAREDEEEDEDGGSGAKSKKAERDAAAELIKTLRQEMAVLQETDPIKKKMLGYADQLAEATGAQKRQVLDLVVALDKAKNGWGAVGRSLAEYAEEAKRIGDDVGDALVGGFKAAEDAVAEFVKTGKLEVADLAASVIADMAKIATRRYITGPLAEGLSGALSGISFGGGGVSMGTVNSTIGSLRTQAANAPSFAGGGHTGHGARSGGLDGRGGFMAVLHPQERVRDDFRGSGPRERGGSAPVTVNINGVRDAESFRRSRTQVAADVSRAVAMGRRNQ